MSLITPKIDWEAYFVQFKEHHGEAVPLRDESSGEVVELVFRDGWRYKASQWDHGEIKPTKDNVEELKALWMSTKIRNLKDEIRHHELEEEKLTQLDSTTDLPLILSIKEGENVDVETVLTMLSIKIETSEKELQELEAENAILSTV